jgi:hypothetical protein
MAADPSAQLRDRLLGELSGLQSSDEAANWVKRILPAKNTLIVADVQLIEDGFRVKMAALEEAQPGDRTETAQSPNAATTKTLASLPTGPRTGRGQIAAKTIRLRDKDHRKFVSSHPCLVCGRLPADTHHLRFAQPRALGRKTSSLSQCAVSIIASCTGMATRRRGGERPRSIRFRSRAGFGSTRGLTARR